MNSPAVAEYEGRAVAEDNERTTGGIMTQDWGIYDTVLGEL